MSRDSLFTERQLTTVTQRIRVPGGEMARRVRGPGGFHFVAVLWIAASVALALPASVHGSDLREPTRAIASDSTLPSNVVLTLGEVKQVLPEMSQVVSTGEDETALGTPGGSRGVTYATDDGMRRVVISVAQYQSADEASSTYLTAVQASLAAPGGSGEALANLGEEAFIGVSGRGDETHVGAGALYGDLIVNVTLQGYDGTPENFARVTELLRMEAAAATRALQLIWSVSPRTLWS